jgi:hypothetical protein
LPAPERHDAGTERKLQVSPLGIRALTQPQDDSADPRVRELIYCPGTVIRLREQGGEWVWMSSSVLRKATTRVWAFR